MHVLILHHHLNPGGVTKVIESQIQAIKFAAKNISISIICGDANGRTAFEGCMINQNKIINYLEKKTDNSSLISRVAEITAFIRNNIRNDTVLHCHNLNLGKNPLLLMAVFNLASEGVAVVNHCHDFAEDRPENLKLLEQIISQNTKTALSCMMYPSLSHYEYIVLNSCDYERIIALGARPDKVHLLQNPVMVRTPIKSTVSRAEVFTRLGLDPQKKLCLYPVRAITRKNIGECILLAVLFAETIQFAVTQPPRNPLELPQYEHWKEYCAKRNINLKFEAGTIIDYEDLMNISDFCITTSYREGFGMVYLEPWLAGTPVVGRELPCVIIDIKKKGVQFPRLYEQIRVIKDNKFHDFKDFTVDSQERYINDIIDQPDKKEQLLSDNPFLRMMFDPINHEVIKVNQEIIRRHFSIEQYGKKLLEIYRKISW
jgi:glycosyltransferase involved in cell wall biosynthesis